MRRLSPMIALIALMAPGCVNVLPKAAPASPRFLIAAVEYDAPSGAPVAWSLTVEDPQATRVYDNARIALAREPGRVEFYAGAEWADRAPLLFQAALVRSFENTGRILGVGDRTAQPVSDFALQTDIRRMEADLDSAKASAVFSVYARLVDNRGKVIAGRLFKAEEPAAADTGPGVAKALDKAAGAAMTEMVEWAFAEAEKARVSKTQ